MFLVINCWFILWNLLLSICVFFLLHRVFFSINYLSLLLNSTLPPVSVSFCLTSKMALPHIDRLIYFIYNSNMPERGKKKNWSRSKIHFYDFKANGKSSAPIRLIWDEPYIKDFNKLSECILCLCGKFVKSTRSIMIAYNVGFV